MARSDMDAIRAELADLRSKIQQRPTIVSGLSGEKTFHHVRQSSHGFAVGDVIRHNGTSWTKSQADTSANSVVGGVVVMVMSSSVFIFAMPGSYVYGLSGLTAGSVHYLDASTAGAITTTAPDIAVPIIHADTTSSGVLMSAWPSGGASAPPSVPTDVLVKTTTETFTITGGTATAWWVTLIAGGAGGGGSSNGTSVDSHVGGGGGGGSGQAITIGPITNMAGNELVWVRGAAGTAGAVEGPGGNGGNSTLIIRNTPSGSVRYGTITAYGGAFGTAGAAVTSTGSICYPGVGGTMIGAFPDSYSAFILRHAAGHNGRLVYYNSSDLNPKCGGLGGKLGYTNSYGDGGTGGDEYNKAGSVGIAGALIIAADGTFS